MQKRKIIPVIAALMLGSALLLGGCGKGADEALSVSDDEEEVTEITSYIVTVHFKIYNEDVSYASDVTISFYEDGELLASAAADENGWTGGITLTSNTELTCVVTDSSGDVLAETGVNFEISTEYDSITIFTMGEEDTVQAIGVPADKTEMTARIFLTEDSMISYANMTAYDESDEPEEEEETGETVEGTVEDAEEGSSDDASEDTSDTADEAEAE